jgi:FkbM family methyltransferase
MRGRYRFRPSIGWVTHLWKSTTRQDHAWLRPVLRPLLPPDGVAIDVGAHGGQVTRLLAGLVPRGLVVAIEPSGYARSVLRSALWLRGIRNAVVVAGALGAVPAVAVLRTPIKRRGDMGYGLAHIAVRGGADDAPLSVTETVLVTTLDALVAVLALDRLDFVKIDIEGHEAAMIAGARETLRRYRPALLVEHDATFSARAGTTNEDLWAQLKGLGYTPFSPRDPAGVAAAEASERQGDVLWLARPT